MKNSDIKKEVRRFWNSSPCGTYLIKHREGTPEYYREIDLYRYSRYPYAYSYLPGIAGFSRSRGKSVLEVGCGVGTDLAQFAKHGADVTGIDMSSKEIELAKKRFKVTGLKGRLVVGDAENLPFDSECFDLVYSFGALHHTPDTKKAIDEIHRVLKPNGKTIIMLYHKRSFEYLTQIVRKFIHPSRWKWTLQEAVSYQTEMNKNPSGPTNPLTKVYTKREAGKLFDLYKEVETKIYYLRIPILGRVIPNFFLYYPSRIIGWHIIIKAKK